MKKIKSCLMLFMVLLGALSMMVPVDGRLKESMKKEMAIEQKLKQLNKPALKTIHSENGDIIDCVDIYKQPAFDHPLLKNHKIQMKPSEETQAKVAEMSSTESPSTMHIQLWTHNESCPEGTVPILRVQKQHLINAASLENYGRKPYHGVMQREVRLANSTVSMGFSRSHEESVLLGAGYSYLGIKAELGVWNPRVAAQDEYSSGQFALRNGPFDKSDSIEAGWMVNPQLHGDYSSRFFIYWTHDSGLTTGCYNVLCPGFVLTGSNSLLGSRLEPISIPGGDQYSINPIVIMDLKTYDKWWVYFKSNTPIGYYPIELFGAIGKVGALALFGGDVYSPRMEQQPPHTTTQMGSGQYSSYHWGNAAFVRTPRVLEYSLTFEYPDPGQTFIRHVDCYSGENYAEVRFTEPLFYYGGPGQSRFCP